jgi:cell division protein FtsW
VAKLRGDALQPSAGNIPPTTQPVQAAAAARGTSRLRQRIEPTLGRRA